MTAEIWPPAQFIRDEMEYLGWTVDDLCRASGLSTDEAQAILDGAEITSERAQALSSAFGTGPIVWRRLQVSWDTSLAAELDRRLSEH